MIKEMLNLLKEKLPMYKFSTDIWHNAPYIMIYQNNLYDAGHHFCIIWFDIPSVLDEDTWVSQCTEFSIGNPEFDCDKLIDLIQNTGKKHEQDRGVVVAVLLR